MPRRVLAVLACLLLAACTATAPEPTTTPEVTASATATRPTATATPTAAADPVRAELSWFLGALAGDETTEEDYEERFAQSFRDAVPYAMFVQVLDQLRPGGPYQLGEVEERPPLGLSATITGADSAALVVHLELDDDGRIAGLLVQPAEPPQLEDPPTSPLEAAARLGELGTVRMLGARIEGSSCTPCSAPGRRRRRPSAPRSSSGCSARSPTRSPPGHWPGTRS